MRCAACGRDNPPGAAFCGQCGAMLPPPQAMSGPIPCPRCGSPTTAGSGFCGTCGAPLPPALPPSGPGFYAAASSGAPPPWVWIAVSAAVVLLAGAAAFAVWLVNRDDGAATTLAGATTTSGATPTSQTPTTTASTTTQTTGTTQGTTTTGSTTTVTSDSPCGDPGSDALYAACAGGDMQACDNLYQDSPDGSECKHFADTCGGRTAGGTWCVGTLYSVDPDNFLPEVFGSPGDPNGSGCAPPGDVLPDGVWFGFAEAVSGGRITLDLACYFTGAAADAAANADYGTNEGALDGFHIRNQNPKVFSVPIAPTAEVYYVDQAGPTWFPEPIPLASWPSPNSWLPCPGETCAVWLYINGGSATGIVEQFLP